MHYYCVFSLMDELLTLAHMFYYYFDFYFYKGVNKPTNRDIWKLFTYILVLFFIWGLIERQYKGRRECLDEGWDTEEIDFFLGGGSKRLEQPADISKHTEICLCFLKQHETLSTLSLWPPFLLNISSLITISHIFILQLLPVLYLKIKALIKSSINMNFNLNLLVSQYVITHGSNSSMVLYWAEHWSYTISIHACVAIVTIVTNRWL